MRLSKLLCGIMAALMLTFALSACRKENNLDEPVRYTPNTVSPIKTEEQVDYTADADTVAQLDALQKSFSGVVVSPVDDFKFAEADGGLAVIDYIGNAQDVRIPDAVDEVPVVSVADAAFAGKTSIRRLYLPDSILRVGTGILRGCTALTALRTPLVGDGADKAFLGYLFGSEGYMDNARDVPASLAYLELGGRMEKLDDFALFDCNDLVYVSLPASLTAIGSYAFYHCTGLLALDLSHVVTLEAYALDRCDGLTRLDFGSDTTSFGLGALHGCIGLRRLTLPFVGGSADANGYLGYLFGAEVPEFSGGYYPPYLVEVKLLPGCTRLSDYAFYQCKSLTRLTLPEGISSIGVRAFSGCTRLTAVTIPASVQTIRENAFFGCYSLAELVFADDSALSSLGVNAFYSCHALTEITLPANLTALPASAFADCVSLSAAHLGGVTSVGRNAFHRCTALVTVTAAASVAFESGNDCAVRCME